MAERIKALVDKIKVLEDQIDEDADYILKLVDVKALLEDPEKEVRRVTMAFFHRHYDKVELAAQYGEEFAQEVLENCGKSQS